jgi:hypothetical protein
MRFEPHADDWYRGNAEQAEQALAMVNGIRDE